MGINGKPFFILTATGDVTLFEIKADIVQGFGLDAIVQGILLSEGEEMSDAFVVTLPKKDDFPDYLQAAKNFAHKHNQDAFYFIDDKSTLTSFNEENGVYKPEYGFIFKQVPISMAHKQHEYFIDSGGESITYWVID